MSYIYMEVVHVWIRMRKVLQIDEECESFHMARGALHPKVTMPSGVK
jgi:hypothetical protein